MPKGQIKPKLDNPETVRKLEQAFALDCSIPEACLYADIHKDTYYELLKYKPNLSDRFETLRNKPVLIARQTVVNSCKDNPEMALKYLERKMKKEFSSRTEIEQEIIISEPLKFDITLSGEALDAAIQKILTENGLQRKS